MINLSTKLNKKEIQDLLGRSALFQVLSFCFRYPTTALGKEINEMLSSLTLKDFSYIDALLELSNLSSEATQTVYTRLFGSGGKCQDCESGYVTDRPCGGIISDVAGFYQAFDFPVEVENADPIDHISLELEFIAFLLAKEAYALYKGLPEAKQICQQAKTKFLKEHLSVWMPQFAEVVERHDSDGFYHQAAFLSSELIRKEIENV